MHSEFFILSHERRKQKQKCIDDEQSYIDAIARVDIPAKVITTTDVNTVASTIKNINDVDGFIDGFYGDAE